MNKPSCDSLLSSSQTDSRKMVIRSEFRRSLALFALLIPVLFSVNCSTTLTATGGKSSGVLPADTEIHWAMAQKYRDNAMASSFKSEVQAAFDNLEDKGVAEFEKVARDESKDVQIGLWDGPKAGKSPIYSKSEIRDGTWTVLLNVNANLSKGQVAGLTATELLFLLGDNSETATSSAAKTVPLAKSSRSAGSDKSSKSEKSKGLASEQSTEESPAADKGTDLAVVDSSEESTIEEETETLDAGQEEGPKLALAD